MHRGGLVLLTGATGYIGGRLIRPLEATGRPLRLMVRDPERLRPAHPPASFVPRVADTTELVRGDVFDPASLAAALAGVDTAYYLVHSLGTAPAISTNRNSRRHAISRRRRGRPACGASSTWAAWAAPKTRSRRTWPAARTWAALLCESGVETIEFRASVVLGSGSISFEMIRALVDRLPVLLTPRWVSTLASR